MVNFLLPGLYYNVFFELYIIGVLKKSKEAIFHTMKNAKSIEVTYFLFLPSRLLLT